MPASQADRLSVADFIGELYNQPGATPTPRELHEARATEMLAAGPTCFLVHDGLNIGYAALKDMGDHMFVRHFVISEKLRGKGIGAEAFRALEAACFAGRQVRLDASCELPGPRAFWEAQGFAVMGYTMRRSARTEDAA